MDPLSIAAGAAGLTTGCATIVRTIYTLIDDTVDVDENVSGLCDEVAALSRVLESVSQASISAPRVVIAEVDPDESLWITVKATLGDIKTTLDKLNQLLAEIQKASTSVFSRGFLRKPTKQLRFSMRLKDITIHRDRIKSYNTAMTSALQMINVCLMIQSNSSQDAIFSVLSNLRSQVNRVELALHVEHRPDAVEEKEEDDRISRNLRQFVRVAENFHSSASTIVGEGPRSTVWGGSILGDPLTEDQYSNIQGWIPPPIDEEVEDGTYSPSSALGRGHNSDSDDDIDKDLVKRLEELALESEQNRDFAKAENFYKKVVDRREASHSPAHDLVATKVSLAYAYLHQEKWSEAESIIAPIAWGKKVPVAGAKAYAGLHALALAHLKNADFESADRCCKRSLWGKRKLFGKSHPSYYETLGLLASICDARNDAVEAEAHRSFIPVGYEHVERDPLAYLNRSADEANPLLPAVLPAVNVSSEGTTDSSTHLRSISEPTVIRLQPSPAYYPPPPQIKQSQSTPPSQQQVPPPPETGPAVIRLKPSPSYYPPAPSIEQSHSTPPSQRLQLPPPLQTDSQYQSPSPLRRSRSREEPNTYHGTPSQQPPPQTQIRNSLHYPSVQNTSHYTTLQPTSQYPSLQSTSQNPYHNSQSQYPAQYAPPQATRYQPPRNTSPYPSPQPAAQYKPLQNAPSQVTQALPSQYTGRYPPSQATPPYPTSQNEPSQVALYPRKQVFQSQNAMPPLTPQYPSATQNAGFNPLPQAQQQQPSAGAPKPELATRGKSRLIVAVHFGTEKCAVAFAFSRGTEAKEDIITEWPGAWSYSKPTIPTILYYDQSRRVVGWGCDIADALAPTGYPKPGIMKVEWFPLQLALGEGAAIDPINLPPLPEGKSAIDVSADYLFKLRMAIRSTLQKTLGAVFEAEESNISWCFTTQAVWSNRGRDALRSAIITAGYIRTEQDPRLMFVTEPEAAAFFCSKSGLLNLKLEDAVLVLECGKGTVDLSAFEVKSENPFALGELTAGSGDSCGSSALNRNFSNILRTKIRKMKLPDGSRTAGKVYAKSIMDFENRIKTDFRNNGQKWAVDVGIETQFPEADIDEGYMVFTNEEILQCFEPVVNRILELVRNQIIAVQAQNRTLQNILVTGEFGASEYLFQQIKLHVPLQFQRKVVRPMDSVSCIVKGAVTAGVTYEWLGVRKGAGPMQASRTYMIKDPYHSHQYSAMYLGTAPTRLYPDGIHRVPDAARAIAEAGHAFSELQVIENKMVKFYQPYYGEAGEFNSLVFRDNIYVALGTDAVSVIDEYNSRLLGFVEVHLDLYSPDAHFRKFYPVPGGSSFYYLVEYTLRCVFTKGRLEVTAFFKGTGVSDKFTTELV